MKDTSTDGPPEKLASTIADDINLLIKLSNNIRKVSRGAQDLKMVIGFEIENEQGLKDLFFAGILERKFPNLNMPALMYLKTRLSSAMLLQRKIILYQRSRYHNIGELRSTRETVAAPVLQKDPSTLIADDKKGIELSMIKTALPDAARSKVAPSATILCPQETKKLPSASMISTAKRTIPPLSHEYLPFPDPPRLKDGQDEAVCPYCFFILSNKVFSNTRKWE